MLACGVTGRGPIKLIPHFSNAPKGGIGCKALVKRQNVTTLFVTTRDL